MGNRPFCSNTPIMKADVERFEMVQNGLVTIYAIKYHEAIDFYSGKEDTYGQSLRKMWKKIWHAIRSSV